MKRYSVTLIFHIVLLAILSVGCYLLLSHQLWFSALLTLFLLLTIGIRLYRIQMKQVATMLRFSESIRHNDLTQAFLPPFKSRVMKELSDEISQAVQEFRTQLLDEEVKHQYYENLLNKVDTAVLVTDKEGRIEWRNPAATQLLNNRDTLPEELKDTSINDIQVIRLQQEGVAQEMAVSRTRFVTQGKERWLISLKNIHSVLERNEMEAWQKLIRVLTHEIMNSITPIISLAETISEREIPQEPTTKEYQTLLQAMQTIHRRSKGLLDFVENYRRLTRIPAPIPARVPVADLFADLRKLFPGEEVRFELPTPEATLFIDRTLIEQVLINLLKNAREASDKNAPEVRVASGCTTAGNPIITVADNGDGILPEVLDKIFVPFFTTKPAGSGIGLSLCKQIMTLHNGSITVLSAPGDGTCIRLLFPPSF